MRYNHQLAIEAAEESGRGFLEFGPAILDRLLTSNNDKVTAALAVILSDQVAAVRSSMLRAGASEREASAVAETYRRAADCAGADRRRRAAH